MQPYQAKLATALLAAGLSQQGLIKAETIMSLDQVLLMMEQGAGPNRRDPDNYYVTMFGTPAANGTWGYRVEGHHLSQNYTIVNGKVCRFAQLLRLESGRSSRGAAQGLACSRRRKTTTVTR